MNKIIEISSYFIFAVFLIFTYNLRLMGTLISGVVIFLIINKLYNYLTSKFTKAKNITFFVVTTTLISSLCLIIFGLVSLINGYDETIKSFIQDVFTIMQESKNYLPDAMLHYIPTDIFTLQQKLFSVATEQKPHIFELTSASLKTIAHIFLGILLGTIISISFLGCENVEYKNKPLTKALLDRVINFVNVFERVMFAQGKISLINTSLTAIYLIILLPLFNIEIPYVKTLILLTFCVGLIPVLGNLISNTFIVIMSITVSLKIAILSLIFLIVIHKLEYYINAKIIGHKIQTSIWEILIAMIVMESLFGLIGVATAPIIYGYIKEELKIKGLI